MNQIENFTSNLYTASEYLNGFMGLWEISLFKIQLKCSCISSTLQSFILNSSDDVLVFHFALTRSADLSSRLTSGSPWASGWASHVRKKLSVTGTAGAKEQTNVTSFPLATLYSLLWIDTCKLQQQGSTRDEKLTLNKMKALFAVTLYLNVILIYKEIRLFQILCILTCSFLSSKIWSCFRAKLN